MALLPTILFGLAISGGMPMQEPEAARPNILFAIADDWGWPHAGVYGDPAALTPTFDRIAREGVLFEQAHVAVPSCTASRASILTGCWPWRLDQGANLYGSLPIRFDVYPDLLENEGYFVGHTRKGWGPGRLGGRERNPAGPRFEDFRTFLEARPGETPFCFWFGGWDPHRGYQPGTGEAAGINPATVRLPACFPDTPAVRSDVADYLFEVKRFDEDVGHLLDLLEERGELQNTIVIMTGDHGMPFPRCKANVYDTGTHVPLAVRWPEQVTPGRRVADMVSLIDVAPTLLAAANCPPSEAMDGISLMPILEDDRSGWLGLGREHVFTMKERHVPCQEKPQGGGAPMRAVRTPDHLYIRNLFPDRWPSGTPEWQRASFQNSWLGDCDNSPTKTEIFLARNRDEESARFYDLAFGKRPAEELYVLGQDPGEIRNVAQVEGYSEAKEKLARLLDAHLRATGDPRIVGGGEAFDTYPYSGGGPQWPWEKPAEKRSDAPDKKGAR